MKTFSPGQTVNYVAAPEKEGGKVTIRKAKIKEVFAQPSESNPGGSFHLDISTGKNEAIALAVFSEDHTKENTFDATDESIITPASANGSSR